VAKKASKKAKTRKSTSRPAKKSTRGAKSEAAKKGQVDLKKIKKDLERALAHVRQAPARDIAAAQAGMDTATKLTRMMADIDDICNSGDCGSSMIFPPPPPNS